MCKSTQMKSPETTIKLAQHNILPRRKIHRLSRELILNIQSSLRHHAALHSADANSSPTSTFARSLYRSPTMPLDPLGDYLALICHLIQSHPQLHISNNFFFRIPHSVSLPAFTPLGQPFEHVLTVREKFDLHSCRRQQQTSIAAVSSAI